MFLSFGKYCISKPKIPLFLGFIIMVLGILSVLTIPKESAPYIEYGIVSVTTVNPGVSAEDIDESITRKIENKLTGISDIETMKSSSKDGSSHILLTLETGIDIGEVVSDVRNAVEDAQADLPSDLQNDPTVVEIDSLEDKPFLQIALLTDSITPEALSEIAEKLKIQLESVSGVGNVTIIGKVDTEVHILLDKEKLEALSLSYNQVKNSIVQSEKNVSMGIFTENGVEYSMKFEGESKNIQDLKNIIVGRLGAVGDDFSARVVYLGEIADIKLSSVERKTITRFNTKQGIIVKVSPKEETDIFSTEKKVQSVLHTFIEQPEYKKISLESVVFAKSTEVMQKDYKNLLISFLFSIVVVLISIFFFIGVKEGIVASFVIPISFLGTVFVLNMLGRTMNFMTNFGMILALGILVDTAIVMVEGTSHYIKKGLSPKNAALQSFIEFSGPLFSGMLTTLIVFLPLFFLPGVVGKFLSFIPVTVSIVLTVALFVSLFIIPALSAVILHAEQQHDKFQNIRKVIDKKIDAVIAWYTGVLEKILRVSFIKYGIFISTLLLFVGTMFLPSQFEMFPTVDSDRVFITVQLPSGTDTENVVETIKDLEIEEFLEVLPETSNFSVTITNNIAKIVLELLPFKERESAGMRTSSALESLLVHEFSDISESIIFQAQREKKGPKSGYPVGIHIVMQEYSLLDQGKEVTAFVTEILKEIDGTQGVVNSITERPGEFNFVVDKEKAFLRGVNPLDIPLTIAGSVYGSTVATFKKEGVVNDIDIRLQFREDQVSNIENIVSIEVAPGVKLSDVVTVYKETGLAEITRDDGNLVFTVSSFLTEDGNAQEITTRILEILKNKELSGELVLPLGITIEDASENKNNEKLMKAMGSALVLAILMMFFILVIQFEAYSPPLLILQTVIFAQIGVSIGLFLTGTDKSMSYMLGLISLSGIVVNDAIILVDKIRENVFSGTFANKIEAIVNAGKTRFIPVVLTTLTTSAGIFPLIFIDSFWAGLAYTIIFGLSVSSLLTLFLIPIGYMLFQKK